MEERAKRFRTALDYLKQNGIIRTQQELADKMGSNKSTVSAAKGGDGEYLTDNFLVRFARALGHGGHSVTDIYIDFDQRKVDDANRRVIDWVLYGNKTNMGDPH